MRFYGEYDCLLSSGNINVLEFDRGNVRMPWTVEIGKQNFKCMIKIKRQDSFAVMQSVLAF